MFGPSTSCLPRILIVLACVLCSVNVCTSQQFKPVDHSPGLCLWYGQCQNVSSGSLNCYDNTPARSVPDGSEMYTLLREVCPWYVQPGGATKVCCDVQQLRTLRNQVVPAKNFIQRCPSCYTNFMKYFCATTCDPNAATFMNITEDDWNPKTNAIKSVSVAMVADFASGLFDSCKNVQSSQEGTPVIGLMCGTSAANCNGQKWLGFLGNPGAGSPTPFPFAYTFPASDAPLAGGVVPFNRSLLRCWEPDFYSLPRNQTCSCVDCPGVCPATPTHHLQTVPQVLHVNAYSFVVLMMAVGWILVGAVAVGCICFAHHHHSGVSRVYTLTEEKAGGAAAAEGPRPSATPTPLLAYPFVCVDCLGYYMELGLSRGFRAWGALAAYGWFVVIPVGVLICTGLSIGLLTFEITTDPVQLWSAAQSEARLNKNYFDSHFGPFYRTEQIIITPVNSSAHPSFSVQDPTGFTISKTMGAVFTKEVLTEVFQIHDHIAHRLTATAVNASGAAVEVGLTDICFKAVNEFCIIQSVLQYFQNNASMLNFTRSDFFSTYGNWLSHIDYCVSDPTSVNASDTYQPCLGKSGAPVDPNIALGGFPEVKSNSSGGSSFIYDNATALIVTFVVNNHLDPGQNKMAEAWEKEYIKYLMSIKDSLEHIKITFSSERSIEDEISRESNSDLITIAVSYGVMFLYVIIFIGGFRSVWTIPIDRLYLTGTVGVLLVIMAVTSSIGFMSYLGITGSLIIIEVVPFLVLAVGVDNLFIIVHAYERCRKARPHQHVNKCISQALGEVAPSITLTALSEAAAFMLGSVSPMPAVRTFSLYAGLAVFINFLLQITIFVSVLKCDMWLRECCTKAACKDLKESNTSVLKIVVKQYSQVLLHWAVRPFVLIFFGLTTFLSISVIISGFDIGLDQNLALPSDSFLIHYFDDMYQYLHTGPPVYFVVEEGYNYSHSSQWNNICTASGCSNQSMGLQIALAAREPDYSYIAEPAANWIDTYLSWINPTAKCCGYLDNEPELTYCELWNKTGSANCVPCIDRSVFNYTKPTPEEFLRFLPLFKLSNPSADCDQGGHAAFNVAVEMKDNNTAIGATYFMTYSTILKTSDEYVGSVRRIKDLSAQLSDTLQHPVFAYSVYFVFYEQYLTTGHLTVVNLCSSLAAVALMTFCLMRLSFGSTFIVVGTVASVIVDMLALMIVFSISLNAISLVNLVMTVGIAVEFCSHIVRWFYKSRLPSRLERAEDAMVHMGTSVISGITITKFLGVFILLFAKSRLFEVFYFRMYMCMILTGVSHGLILLPVVLSYFGPTPRWQPKRKLKSSRSDPEKTVPHSNGTHVATPPSNGTFVSPSTTNPASPSLYPSLPTDYSEKRPLLS